jgi:hypothetical protein
MNKYRFDQDLIRILDGFLCTRRMSRIGDNREDDDQDRILDLDKYGCVYILVQFYLWILILPS